MTDELPAGTPSAEPPPGSEPTTAEVRITELEARLAASEALATAAVARYREALLTAAPELPAELVAGSTVEEIDAAIERARRIVEAIRERLPQPSSPGPTAPGPAIPAGAPVRSGSAGRPAWAGTSATERVRAAVSEGS